MFGDFLYVLRKNDLKVSLTEWMSLMEALDKGLHGSSFTGFYCYLRLVTDQQLSSRMKRICITWRRTCFCRYNCIIADCQIVICTNAISTS